MEPELSAFNERRKIFEADKAQLAKIVAQGKEEARASAAPVLLEAKKAMRIIK